jgi:uncharacterized protein YkwD
LSCPQARQIGISEAYGQRRATVQVGKVVADRSIVGIEDRDWYRKAPKRGVSPGPTLAAAAIVVVLVIGAALHVTRGRHVADPEHQVHRDTSIGFFPGLELPLTRAPLYPAHDPWQKYLADEQICPGGEDANAPLQKQAQTMVCLIDFVRQARGLGPLQVSPLLSASSRLKGEAIARCKVFAHAPCGGDPHEVAVETGYVGAWGENLEIADGRFGAPRVALDGWLNSPGHRENLFRPDWRVHSLYVVRLTDFPDFHDPTLWVSEFGDR